MAEKSYLVRVLPEGREVRLKAGEILADALVQAGFPLSLYCHKRGVCGKCAVRVVEGMLPLPDAQEEKLLALRGLGPDHRLACRLTVLGDLAVEVPPGSRLEKVSVLETGISAPVVPEPQVRKFAVSIPGASLEAPSAVTERLAAALGLPDLVLPLACLKRREAWDALSNGRLTAVLYGDREVLDLEAGDTSGQAFGLAVDIGTTTVVAEILDLADGRSVDRTSALNSQSAYGADVVSRISFAFQSPDNLSRLRNAVTRQLDDLVGVMTSRSGLARDRIYEAVIAGNTAMTHFLAGVPVDTLALSPFNAVFTGSAPVPASELGLSLHPSARAYIVPNIKSFVGGDITAGLSASDFDAQPGRELFIDLGTNGEIVLKNGRDFVATSTAAGPAFEGMSISCGMLAVPGAACRARWEDGGFRLETIGGLAPQGLCGTGLLDVLALGVRHGLIEKRGKISGPEKVLRLGDSLSLTQQDVRELQLALAAVKSGVRMMLREFKIPAKRLDGVCVAGAFGASLDIGNCRTLGLLSEVPAEKIRFVGNTALAGARKLLLSAPQRAAAEALAAKVTHLSLASRPDFQDEFVKSLEFAEGE